MWQEGQSEVELPTEDAFQRLIAHGLAAFHGLLSFSRQGASGQGRSVTVRKPKGFGEGPEQALRGRRETGSAASSQTITCADILFALEETPRRHDARTAGAVPLGAWQRPLLGGLLCHAVTGLSMSHMQHHACLNKR